MIETFDLIDDENKARRVAIDSANLLKDAWKKDRFSICGKRPSALLAGAIYICCILNKVLLTQNRISEQLNVSRESIRKSYLLIIKILNIDYEWFEEKRFELGYTNKIKRLSW